MIDFEQIRCELIEEINSEIDCQECSPEQKQFMKGLTPQIVFICCQALMKYHDAQKNFEVSSQADH